MAKSKYSGMSKDQLFDILRREILAARLKVTLDEQLNRETSDTVRRLANMKLPPIVRRVETECNCQCDCCSKERL